MGHLELQHTWLSPHWFLSICLVKFLTFACFLPFKHEIEFQVDSLCFSHYPSGFLSATLSTAPNASRLRKTSQYTWRGCAWRRALRRRKWLSRWRPRKPFTIGPDQRGPGTTDDSARSSQTMAAVPTWQRNCCRWVFMCSTSPKSVTLLSRPRLMPPLLPQPSPLHHQRLIPATHPHLRMKGRATRHGRGKHNEWYTERHRRCEMAFFSSFIFCVKTFSLEHFTIWLTLI